MKPSAKFLLILAIIASSPTPVFPQTDYRAIFASAYALYSARNFSLAKALFHKTLDRDFPLADYSHYYLGMIAFHEANWDASRHHLSQLSQHYPQSVWFYPATLQKAKISIAERNYPRAIDSLRALRTVGGLKNQISEEALYLLAQVQEAQQELVQAHASYQELRSVAP